MRTTGPPLNDGRDGISVPPVSCLRWRREPP